MIFEVSVVEIRDISTICQFFPQRIVDGDGLADFRNSIFDVDISYMQHV